MAICLLTYAEKCKRGIKIKVNRARQNIPHLLCPHHGCFNASALSGCIPPQNHCFSLFLSSPVFYFFPPGALFSPTVAAAVAVVYLMCSLRFLIDTETGAIPPISITPWVTALKNCTSIILEICFVL